MTTPSTTSQDLLLPVSVRDVQFLVAVNALYSTLASDDATNDQIEHNIVATHALFVMRYYSADEANALSARIQNLLPAKSNIAVIREDSHVSYTQ